jgi:hypothetical protein
MALPQAGQDQEKVALTLLPAMPYRFRGGAFEVLRTTLAKDAR